MHYRSQNEYFKFFDLKTQLSPRQQQIHTLPSTNRKIQNYSLTNRSQQKDKKVIYEIEGNSKIDRQTYNHFLNYKNRRPTRNLQKNTLFQHGILKQSSKPLERLHSQSYRQNQSQNKNQSQRDILLNTKFFLSPRHLHKKIKQETFHQNILNEKPIDIPTKEKILYLQNSQTDIMPLLNHNICQNPKLGIKNKYKIISYAKKDDPQFIQYKKDNENIDDDNSEWNLVLFRSKKEL
ncbi:unnamed protein product [Paramecium sonneborni]|uniref:Uncharacterized protein n=1 Tax=Paramecium sonneborni TaxID=65129 RepID=A0A8S1MSW6_9CILI|nr:unnamed protein product [Paramecium sonneborni]